MSEGFISLFLFCCSVCLNGFAASSVSNVPAVASPTDMRSDIQEIFKMTPHDKQVMMFSATLAGEMRTVCKKFMSNVRYRICHRLLPGQRSSCSSSFARALFTAADTQGTCYPASLAR